MSPLISIVIPVYNAASYLNRCVGSAVNQTYTNVEIILVDDGSKDDSLQISEKWGKQDGRVQVIAQSNKGVSSARNIGIKNATGEYLMLLDSDDWLAVDACETFLTQIVQQNVDCVVCGLRQTSGNIWAPAFNRCYENFAAFKQDFIYWLNTELLSSSVNKIYKRAKIKELYPENMSYGEDLVFVLNYLKYCERISFIQEPLYQHEVHNPLSLTHSFSPARFLDLENIQQSILAFTKDERFPRKEDDIHIYDKYMRDAIRLIRMLYKCEDFCFTEKNEFIRRWVEHSFLKRLKESDYHVHWKDGIILYCLKRNIFIGIDLVVNWKEYIKFKVLQDIAFHKKKL